MTPTPRDTSAFPGADRSIDRLDLPLLISRFFRVPLTGGPAGAALAAGVGYEKRKVKFLANLMAFLAFNPRVGHAAGLHLIRLCDALSYRQLVVVAVVTELSEGPPTAARADLNHVAGEDPFLIGKTGSGTSKTMCSPMCLSSSEAKWLSVSICW